MTGRPSHPSLMSRLMFGEFSYRGLGSAVIKTVVVGRGFFRVFQDVYRCLLWYYMVGRVL